METILVHVLLYWIYIMLISPNHICTTWCVHSHIYIFHIHPDPLCHRLLHCCKRKALIYPGKYRKVKRNCLCNWDGSLSHQRLLENLEPEGALWLEYLWPEAEKEPFSRKCSDAIHLKKFILSKHSNSMVPQVVTKVDQSSVVNTGETRRPSTRPCWVLSGCSG